MEEKYITVCNKLRSALIRFKSHDGNPDYDPAYALYEEVAGISKQMQEEVNAMFQVF